jgi:hypothetical protein
MRRNKKACLHITDVSDERTVLLMGLPVPKPKWVQNLSKPKLRTCGIPAASAREKEVYFPKTRELEPKAAKGTNA